MTIFDAKSQVDRTRLSVGDLPSWRKETRILVKIFGGGITFLLLENLHQNQNQSCCILSIFYDYMRHISKCSHNCDLWTKMLSVVFDHFGIGCFYCSHFRPIPEQDIYRMYSWNIIVQLFLRMLEHWKQWLFMYMPRGRGILILKL